MDRATTSQAKISIQFNDLIARPYFEALAEAFKTCEIYLETLVTNRLEWVSRLGEQEEVRIVQRRMSTAAGTIDLPRKGVKKEVRELGKSRDGGLDDGKAKTM